MTYALPCCRYPLLLVLFAVSLPAAVAQGQDSLTLATRSRTKDKDGHVQVQRKTQNWNPNQTAIVICDMWDDHYCVSAAKRVAEMAPHMNHVITEARKKGVLIIHCPSGCMDVYKDMPQRKLAQQAPKVETKIPLKNWCYIDKDREVDYPVDESEPCDDAVGREKKRFYDRQIETLKIADGDAITDSAEAFYLMKQKGIKNVILMGVHTNMCVLGRPFGIRQMVYQGMNVVLMRDMTDAMYSPKCKPFVSHFRGLELVVEHIEQYWCPTITSTDFTGQAAFRFQDDDRPHVVFVVGGSEYDAEKTMPQLAHELSDRYGCACTVLIGRGKEGTYEIPGLEVLQKADLMVLFARRRALPKAQLDLIRAYLDAGKPLVALRTSSHAFDTDKVPAGYATWPKFDLEVLGCDYTGHGPDGTDVTPVGAAANHPILQRIAGSRWHSSGSLYNSTPVDKSATILLTGARDKTTQPVAWTHSYKNGRVFYTSLGHPGDFGEPAFHTLLVNASFWAMNRPVPTLKEPPVSSSQK